MDRKRCIKRWGQYVLEGHRIEKVDDHNFKIVFTLVHQNAPNMYAQDITMLCHFEFDGDVDDEGRNIDCSFWELQVQDTNAEALFYFFQIMSQINLSDFRPEYLRNGEPDYAAAVSKIEERIKELRR